MAERVWFIPGRPGPPGMPLARYRPIQPTVSAGTYVQHLTQPGDLVVDLFCQGPTVVREATALGRRVLGFSVNPLLLVAARLGLVQWNAEATSPTAVNAAGLTASAVEAADLTASAVKSTDFTATAVKAADLTASAVKAADLTASAVKATDLTASAVKATDLTASAVKATDLTASAVKSTDFTATAVKSAFTRLADSRKGDVPLHQYILSLYHSACPTCGAPGVAEWFAWDRDGNFPYKKAVRCPDCEELQEGTPDDEDVASANRVQPRGLAYYYALDRVSPPGHPARERAAELVGLYTPRNLSALMDITMRLEGMEAPREVKLALTAALLDCFDAASSLDPPGEDRPRARTLRVPSLYLERNVWLCFEERLSQLLNAHTSPPPTTVHRATDVAALVSGEEEGYALVSYAASDVKKIIQPNSAALVIVDPPQPDAVFWALSALWAGWLWESQTARRLRPFLRRRRFDWEWHWRVLRAALQAAGPLLVPGGHLVTLFSERDEELVASVCMAADSAGYGLEGWGYCPEAGHRLVWRWEGADQQRKKPPETSTQDELEQELADAAEEAVTRTLKERGEPTLRPLLHASAYVALAGRGLLARAAAIPKGSSPALTFTANAVQRGFDAAPAAPVAEQEESQKPLWQLADPTPTVETLTDRVEAQVWELLVQRPTWSPEDLINATYSHLSGPLTPDLALVLICIESYSVQVGQVLHLRPEDDPLQRAAELKALRQDLAELGKKLGFRVKQRGKWDVRWLEEGKETYIFDVSSTASLAHHLLTRRAADAGAQRCLVLPGGRSHLVTFKLQHNPRLAQIVDKEEWQFIKFRLLRHLIAEEALDRHALKTVLGLDPIAEQEAAQIPLF